MKKEEIDTEQSKSEEMQTVGDILRCARLKQGKTLNDIAADLCIRRIYLEAIENVEYKKLPAEPYGLGYVKSYAEYLGLNSARIVQSFKETAMPKINSKKKLKAVGDEEENTGPSIKHVIIGFVLMFSVLLGWNLYNNRSEEPSVEIINETPIDETYPAPIILEENYQNEVTDGEEYIEDNEENISQESDSEIETTDDKKSNDEENTSAKEQLENEQVIDNNAPRIKIEVTGDSWVELKHGEDVLLAKVYGKGFEYEVPYNENLEVSVGKRANVNFYIDGKLTQVTAPRKQMRIKLDKFLENR